MRFTIEVEDPALDELAGIREQLGTLMASFDQVRQDYRTYASELKTQRDDAIAAVEAAVQREQTTAQALADFQANDAETDAKQLADQAQANADALQSDLDGLKSAPEPVEPTVTPDQPSSGGILPDVQPEQPSTTPEPSPNEPVDPAVPDAGEGEPVIPQVESEQPSTPDTAAPGDTSTSTPSDPNAPTA